MSLQNRNESSITLLLQNFRLLEASGACEILAASAGEGGSQWLTLGQLCRNYHAWLVRSDGPNSLSAALTVPQGAAIGMAQFEPEINRLRSEIARWREEIEGGEAYLRFVEAFSAFASLDGERAISRLVRCAELLQARGTPEQSLDDALTSVRGQSAPYGMVMSSNDVLQIVADSLTRSFDLRMHALTDIQRFALLPFRESSQ